jgi:hypothetical protein
MAKIKWEYYIAAAVITTVLFAAGLYFGYGLNSEKMVNLERQLRDMRISQLDTELELLLIRSFDDQSCTVLSKELDRIIPATSQLGEDLEFYESSERVKTEDYWLFKKEYTLTLVRYWLFSRDITSKCESNSSLILYFYSNEDCPDCIRQGTVLSFLKKNDPERVKVFALDAGLDINIVGLLKSIYNVTSTPTLVIAEKTYSGFQPLESVATIVGVPV